MKCVLCGSLETTLQPSYKDGQRYIFCLHCGLRHLDPQKRLVRQAERSRYTLHQTAPEDSGYRNFVAPLVARLTEAVAPGACGLDYGAGHQPVLAAHLRTRGFTVEIFDPFFWPRVEVLTPGAYDFIVACEVAEHFFNPADEFYKLWSLLRPGGTLLINTEMYRPTIDFENWYYRRDPTHVVFYAATTFQWIAGNFGFEEPWIKGRVASLKKPGAS